MTHALPMFTAGEDLPLFTGQPVAVQPATFQPKPYYRQLRLEQETSTMTQEFTREEYLAAAKGWREVAEQTLEHGRWEVSIGIHPDLTIHERQAASYIQVAEEFEKKAAATT